MNVTLISVPYHLGHSGIGMANGPARIVRALGGEAGSRGGGDASAVIEIAPEHAFAHEVQATFDVDDALAAAVRRTLAAGELPVVLAANCMSCLGTLAGMGETGGPVAIVWLDAHGDFNTAATTPSGYVDGMALAAAVGREWQAIAASVPGFSPVREADVVHLGGRDFDDAEATLLAESEVRLLTTAEIRADPAALAAALEPIAGRVRAAYLHVDLDVLDVDAGRANAYACGGGLTRAELHEAVTTTARILPLRAVGLTAYDPSFDPDGRVATIAAAEIEALAAG